MRCATCGSENPEGLQFCEECGTKLVPVCPSCNYEVRPTAKFCGTCGAALTAQSGASSRESKQVQSPRAKVHSLEPRPLTPNTQPLSGERRQLTVMFCDLVGSTALSTQLDPEDLRDVIRQYQQTCAAVIERHDGYIAQYLGDGLLVYFGYPTAHEDDARRAVRAGLEIVAAMRETGEILPVPPLSKEGTQKPPLAKGAARSAGGFGRVRISKELQVRIGIHTGLVVIGEMGASGRTEHLALGETPNIAARLQGVAEPNTVAISAATQRVIDGQFELQPFGTHLLKGIETPIAVYHVQSERQQASPLAGRTTLTPLVGREQEVGLLLDRWEQAKEGRGHVVLLSGEPGIGKSRLAYSLREHVTQEGSLLFEARCSPYHQQSAFYPLIEVLQRTLLLHRHDSNQENVEKLERTLALYNMQDSLPLFTALLSFPTPSHYPPVQVTPQKQKERTVQALVQLLVAQAERQATVSVWEDVHWADPSSLEFLSLLIEQIPTTNLLLVLTFRPEFTPLWKVRSHISQLVLNRLGQKHVEAMIAQAAAGKQLSAAVVEQIRVKTDGVPLFVEELTKSVIESGGTRQAAASPLTIPTTLQEALLARLDRLSTARHIAQLGATLGREFSHELIQALASISEADLHAALEKLVEAEILYQRGIGEQARYFFKHALIQDTAYQSLLKSTRQQYHQQIAYVLEERFAQTKETQPELLAHHYTEAGLIEQAIPYWQLAGERASQHSAYVEATHHFTRGLGLLPMLPETTDRIQSEVLLQTLLGRVLSVTKGMAAPEVGATLTRAHELCQQLADPGQLFDVLTILRGYECVRGESRKALAYAEQLLQLAQRTQDPGALLQAHMALGVSYYPLGEFILSCKHSEQGIHLYDPQLHRSHALRYGGYDPKAVCLYWSTWSLWLRGYPDQAWASSREMVTFARELSHPYSLAAACFGAGGLHIFRREEAQALAYLAEAISLCSEYGMPLFLALSTILQGQVWVSQGKANEGLQQIQDGLTSLDTMETRLSRSAYLAYQAEGYAQLGKVEVGLSLVAQALAFVNKQDERFYEAELYRLKGELTLQQESKEQRAESKEQETEECFLKAIAIAQQQQAKSWELRAAMSLVRLRQCQAQEHVPRTTQHGSPTTQHVTRTALDEARNMLSEIYHWFTEGFDTKDLQEAKALLHDLA